jgi:aarF domain-containing kinase
LLEHTRTGHTDTYRKLPTPRYTSDGALTADLAQITFEYPFRIPPYFALVIRAIGVLEGIALVANPGFAIIDEAYPYISKRLLTDPSPRLREALRYMVYGKSNVLDVERLIDLLQNFERFVAVKDDRSGSQGAGGLSSRALESGASAAGAALVVAAPASALPVARATSGEIGFEEGALARDALRFFFSDEGAFFRALVTDETVNSVDALSRQAALELLASLPGAPPAPPGAAALIKALAPPLTDDDRKVVANTRALLDFLLVQGGGGGAAAGSGGDSAFPLPPQLGSVGAGLSPYDALAAARALAPTLTELAPAMRDFAREVTARLVERQAARGLRFATDALLPRGARAVPAAA